MRRLFRSTERGISALVVALSLVALLGFAALAIESGYLFAVRAQAQNAADAAALAGVRALQSCDADGADRAAAIAAARDSMAQNKVDGVALELADSDVVFGRYYPYGGGEEREFVATDSNPNSVRVTAHRDSIRNGPVETVMAKLIGVDSVGVAASGTASRDRRVVGFDPPPGGYGKLIPFAAADSSLGGIGTTFEFFQGSNSQVPGNWGLIDLAPDGTGFQVGISNGQDVVEDQIESGYSGTATLDPDWGASASGRPGTLGGSIADALDARIGDPVVIAVYDSVTGTGTDAVFHIVGFVAVRIEGAQLKGPLADRHVRGTIVGLTDANAVTDPAATENCLISKVVLSR